jgi:hypothetical protein
LGYTIAPASTIVISIYMALSSTSVYFVVFIKLCRLRQVGFTMKATTDAWIRATGVVSGGRIGI